MKYEKLIYAIGYTIVIVAAIMKILHLPYANSILIFSLVGLEVFHSWHLTQLKKRINELEENLKP